VSPKAFIFDVFGTVVDWRSSVAREVNAAFSAKNITIDSLAFADTWRGQYQPAMERIRTGNRGYVALDDLHRENLDETLKIHGLEAIFDAFERDVLNTAWEKLDPWPDVVEGLYELRKKALIAPCSNGSIALMSRLAQYSDLPWACILGADIARNYKPKPEVYHACCDALRLLPQEVMMVAAHNDDLDAAQACGLKTAFIARPQEYGPFQTKDFEATGDWDAVIDVFSDLAAL